MNNGTNGIQRAVKDALGPSYPPHVGVDGMYYFSIAALKDPPEGRRIRPEVVLMTKALYDLPTPLTRWDKAVHTFIRIHPEEEGRPISIGKLIGRLCGAEPPERGAGRARFKACTTGRLCGCGECGGHPLHGKIYPHGLTSFASPLLFTLEARDVIRATWLANGLLNEEDADRILRQTRSLSNKHDPALAQKIVLNAGVLTVQMLRRLFSADLGREDPAQLFWCGHGGKKHIHLHLPRIPGLTRSEAEKIQSKQRATELIEEAYRIGALTKHDRSGLLRDLATLSLPKRTTRDHSIEGEICEAQYCDSF